MTGNNVIPFPTGRPMEAELADEMDWAEIAAHYGIFLYRWRDEGPVSYTDDGDAYLTVTLGRPENDAHWRIDQDRHGYSLWKSPDWWENRCLGVFRTLRDALEAIVATRRVA